MAPIVSPRHLFLRKARQHLGLESETKHFLQDDNDDDPVVDAGDMHLNSFYAPALTADQPYEIAVTQGITIPDVPPGTTKPTLQNKTPQQFSIFAPQFKLEQGDIHSFYPPNAHSDLPNVLPHIVFSDPHLPWERGSKYNADLHGRNRIPWLALLVFDGNNELKLTPTQRGPGGIFPPDMSVNGQPVVQDGSSYAVSMTWDQLNRMDASVPRQISVKDNDKPADIKTPLTVIFPTADLFTGLFAAYDQPAAPGGQPTIQPQPTLKRYQYLAHYRNINTSGMAGAGVQDTGLFSIVTSHRTGPLDLKVPRNMVVHLVTIDGIPENVKFPLSPDTKVGALISLYSWNYRCLPMSSISFPDTMRAICGQSRKMLQPPSSILQQVASWNAPSPLYAQLIGQRLKLGYTLVRYRVQTGEETVAFTRGPLVPVPVDRKSFPVTTNGGQWPPQSNSGADYQILDPQLGIMDITYSSAWQLGRTLALADSAFTTALTRYRYAAFTAALARAKERILLGLGKWRTKKSMLVTLPATINHLSSLHKKALRDPSGDLSEIEYRKRWDREPVAELPDLSLESAEVQTAFKKELDPVMEKLASGRALNVSEGSDGENPEPAPYNEFNAPYHADWPIIQAWLLDKMLLSGIPAHYLITDPSHLPTESIRFFYIDPVWVDCLLDGALSVANHLSRKDDLIRQKIKDRLNTYLKTPLDPSAAHKIYPPVASTGFFLRSSIVEAMPDLQVSCPFVDPDDKKHRAELLRHDMLDKGVMLVLLDRDFDDPNLGELTFAQPPHQQYFSCGDELTGDAVEFQFKKILNLSTPTSKVDPKDPRWGGPLCAAMTWNRNGQGDPPGGPVYDWKTNLIQVENLAGTITNLLDEYMEGQPGWQKDDVPSSAVLAFQLNAPNFYATMANGNKPMPEPSGSLQGQNLAFRQIYLGSEQDLALEQSLEGYSRYPTPATALTIPSRPVFRRQVEKTAPPPQDPAPHRSTPRPIRSHYLPPDGFNPFVFPSGFPPRDRFPKARLASAPSDFCDQGTMATSHRYEFWMYPSYLLAQQTQTGVIPKDAIVPTNANKNIDLISSINLINTTPPADGSKLYLRDIEVLIPVSPHYTSAQSAFSPQQTATSSTGPAVMTSSSYPGKPTMLSNARWVVKASTMAGENVASHLKHKETVAENYLVCRLIPRSNYEMVPFATNRTCSFILPEMQIDTAEGDVVVTFRECYWQYPPSGGYRVAKFYSYTRTVKKRSHKA
ncbi:uncharacterized protein N7482_001087 [Penicillium canariense]|uniref:Uncharacterized protein n=1 Tax=Penicillium canariense TaxID=189055 RepID=A0A9W9IFX1_9EURO|nr:uncharacterized protein N7482_001087 [Penicillium canariense]KAJ5175210.1 hypothetical protein N7482_001087 [Penicillium canariense]